MTPAVATMKVKQFDPATFLSVINGGRKIVNFPELQTIFLQGDPSDAVFYIQKGKVQLSVLSADGKEATIGILKEGDFFGEACLTALSLDPTESLIGFLAEGLSGRDLVTRSIDVMDDEGSICVEQELAFGDAAE